jgi:O-antigen/teichoic acid export membrane protein
MFFAGTLVFRALFGIDRFIVASMTDLETSGIYALYISFGLGIVSILEAGVSAWKYPQLVDALLKRNSRSVVIQLKSFLATNFISSVVLCLCAYAAIQYIVLNFLEPFYNAGLVHLHWILFGAVALSVSLPFHYLLYGLRKDWSFLVIYIFALAAVISYAFLILKDGDVGKVFGLFAIAAFFIAAGRLTFAIGPLKAIYKGSWP